MKQLIYPVVISAALMVAACSNDEPDQVNVVVENPNPEKSEKKDEDGFSVNFKNDEGSFSISDKK